MPRNFDIASVRAFVTVVDVGGVTRAAAVLNLTQSAVSLQLKRLEDGLGQPLIHRGARGVTLTSQGEQFLEHARRLLDVNDRTWVHMTADEPSGEVRLGVPEDLLYPHVPAAMQRFRRLHPGVSVRLSSTLTRTLLDQFDTGGLDVVLATQPDRVEGSEHLCQAPMVWMGARGGTAWKRRPLPLGTVDGCMFTRPAIDALNAANMDWVLALDSATTQAVEASVLADTVMHMQMRGTIDDRFEEIDHGGILPDLPVFHVNMFVTRGQRRANAERLAEQLRLAFAGTAGAIHAA